MKTDADIILEGYAGAMSNLFGALFANLTGGDDQAFIKFNNGLTILREARDRALTIVNVKATP